MGVCNSFRKVSEKFNCPSAVQWDKEADFCLNFEKKTKEKNFLAL